MSYTIWKHFIQVLCLFSVDLKVRRIAYLINFIVENLIGKICKVFIKYFFELDNSSPIKLNSNAKIIN